MNTESILLYGPDGGVAKAQTEMKMAREGWARRLGLRQYITPCMADPQRWDGGVDEPGSSNADAGIKEAEECLNNCHVLTECLAIRDADRQKLTVGYRGRGVRKIPPRPTMAGIPRIRHPLDTTEMGGE